MFRRGIWPRSPDDETGGLETVDWSCEVDLCSEPSEPEPNLEFKSAAGNRAFNRHKTTLDLRDRNCEIRVKSQVIRWSFHDSNCILVDATCIAQLIVKYSKIINFV